MQIDLVAKRDANSRLAASNDVLADYSLFELLGLQFIEEEQKNSFIEQIAEQVLRMVFLRVQLEGKLTPQDLEKFNEDVKSEGGLVVAEEPLVEKFPDLPIYIAEEMDEYKRRAFQAQLDAFRGQSEELIARVESALEAKDREEFIKAFEEYSLAREEWQ